MHDSVRRPVNVREGIEPCSSVSGQDAFRVMRSWDMLTGAESARAFGEPVAAAPRSSAGNTALAPSLRKAADMLSARSSPAPGA